MQTNGGKDRSDGKTRKKAWAATGWPLGKDRILEIEGIRTRPHSVENSLWKRLWNYCKTDDRMYEYIIYKSDRGPHNRTWWTTGWTSMFSSIKTPASDSLRWVSNCNSNICSCTTKSMEESLEKLMVAQLVSRSPSCYRIRKCTDAARTYPEPRPDVTSELSSHSQNVHILLLCTDVCQFGSIAFMCREYMAITQLPSPRQRLPVK